MPRTKGPAKSPAQVKKERDAERERWASLTPEQKEAERHSRFVRLATKRTTKAIQAVSSIGNLSAPAYRYTEAEVQAIVDALSNAVAGVAAQFQPKAAKVAEGFTLPGNDVESVPA